MRKCPRCGLVSPDGSVRCECGFLFDLDERAAPVMTPQLQQAIKVLQLSREMLAETIRDEILKNPIQMIEFLVKRTDGDWFDLPVGSGAYRPKTVPYEAVGTDEQAIRIGECEVSFSFEDPGIEICFHGDIAEELAERVASEVLSEFERSRGRG